MACRRPARATGARVVADWRGRPEFDAPHTAELPDGAFDDHAEQPPHLPGIGPGQVEGGDTK